MNCLACCNSFEPPAPCFYGLCDPCFDRFDSMKMHQRFKGGERPYDIGGNAECVQRWIADGSPVPPGYSSANSWRLTSAKLFAAAPSIPRCEVRSGITLHRADGHVFFGPDCDLHKT
jgi:hypothetical protein